MSVPPSMRLGIVLNARTGYGWRRERERVLWRIAEMIEDQADELARLECRNVGMPYAAGRKRDPSVRRHLPVLRRLGGTDGR